MCSAVSFGSTYKVNNQNSDAFYKFQKYANDKESELGVKTTLKEKIVKLEGSSRFYYMAEKTLIVPDYDDNDVEAFCFRNGIRYKKLETMDLLNPDKIDSRVADAPDGYRKVYIEPEKFEKLIERQDNNIDFSKGMYEKYYINDVDKMLRTGDKFHTTTLNLDSMYDNFDDLRCYVKSYGVKNLNNGQIAAAFTQETDNPDHCVYFALKNIGMKKIPVYVDNKSYETGKILELF